MWYHFIEFSVYDKPVKQCFRSHIPAQKTERSERRALDKIDPDAALCLDDCCICTS